MDDRVDRKQKSEKSDRIEGKEKLKSKKGSGELSKLLKKGGRGRKKPEVETSLTLSDFCGFCKGTKERNRYDEHEDLLTCSECGNSGKTIGF